MDIDIPTPEELDEMRRVEKERKRQGGLGLVRENAEPMLMYMVERLRSGCSYVDILGLRDAMADVSREAYLASCQGLNVIIDELSPCFEAKGWKLEPRPFGYDICFVPLNEEKEEVGPEPAQPRNSFWSRIFGRGRRKQDNG